MRAIYTDSHEHPPPVLYRHHKRHPGLRRVRDVLVREPENLADGEDIRPNA